MSEKVLSFKNYLLIGFSLVIVINLFVTTNSVASRYIPEAYTREIRTIELVETQAGSAVDLSYWPEQVAILVMNRPGGTKNENSIDIVSLYKENTVGQAVIPGLSVDRIIISRSETSNEFLIIDPLNHKSFKIRPINKLFPTQTWSVFDPNQFPETLGTLSGVTFDKSKNEYLFLDTDGIINSLSALQPTADDNFDRISPEQLKPIELKGVGGLQQSASIAINPDNDHVYILDPVSKKIFVSSKSGEDIAFIDLNNFYVINPQAIIFAPSGDPTDADHRNNLYILDSGQRDSLEPDGTQAKLIEIALVEPSVSETPQEITFATHVNTILTSGWSPPSPDPAGITYWESQSSLLVSDSEVNEMQPYFTGFNVFESTNTGTLQNTFTTIDFSNEPTGVSWNASNGHFFYSDDDQDKVFEIDPGPDSLYGTSDDITSTVYTDSFDSFDPEGVTFGLGYLFVLDGVGSEVYVLDPGSDGAFEGVPPIGDDILVRHFDTSSMGLSDPEGIEFSDDSQTLFIVGPNNKNNLIEVSTDGTFISLTDISFLNSIGPAGIAIAPASTNPGVDNLFITDRGIDNSQDKNENDGKIYEITFQSGATPGPSLTPTNTSTITPTGFSTPTDIGPSPTPSSEVIILDRRVQNGGDDAEEYENGTMYITSSDLELVDSSSGNQIVGLRFSNITIPPGGVVNTAYLQFKVDETSSGATNLSISAEASDNMNIFSSTSQDISLRERTTERVDWSPVPWNSTGAAGLDQRSPNIAGVIQEVVDRQGWQSGNSMGIIISGNGVRVAEAYEGDPGGAPLLHIEYQEVVPTSTPTPSATNTITPTATHTLTPTSTNSPVPTATNTEIPTATNTQLPTSTNTPLPTAANTQLPTATSTPLPTATNTQLPTTTNTPIPTATSTEQPNVTNTPIPTATNTQLPTTTNTPLPTATNTQVPTASNTPLPTTTNTPTPTLTDTPLPTVTNTPLPTSTDTPLPTATNTQLPTATNSLTPTPSINETILDIRINNRADDAEESAKGNMKLNSSDLELVYSGGNQTVGMRFNGLTIPGGATIIHAHIQFKVDETTSLATDLIISAEAADHSDGFTTASQNITTRSKSSTSIAWSPAPWLTVAEAGADQRTPNLASIIQEVIDRSGWVSGNSLSIIISGIGERVAESYNGDSNGAPLLHIEFNEQVTTGTPNPSPTSTSTPTSTLIPSPTSPSGVTSLDVRVNNSPDDAEEFENGNMYLSSSDLELVYSGGNQTVGMRFNGLAIPQGTNITEAYIQFKVDEPASIETDLSIFAEATDQADVFTTAFQNISTRPRTSASIAWSPAPWLTIGEAGLDQRTPNLALIIQEVVNRSGWVSGNSVNIIITGSGERVAESYNGDQGGAPLLHIEYQE